MRKDKRLNGDRVGPRPGLLGVPPNTSATVTVTYGGEAGGLPLVNDSYPNLLTFAAGAATKFVRF
jgi:hypothetical protein